MFRILAINPGATSTKIAVFDDENVVFKCMIEHNGDELSGYKEVFEQFQYRSNLIRKVLQEKAIELSTLSAVVGRGGLLKPIAGGTYIISEIMLEDLKRAERGEHASNLGAAIAFEMASKLGIPSFIVDPVAVDEMEPEARISGMAELTRISMSHALNSKAVAKRMARDMGEKYEDLNIIVAHLGTGVSVTPHKKGRMIDVNNAQEEGPFSPDRTGGLPVRSLVKLCYSGKYSEKEMLERISGSGGMFSYLGTKDVREAEKRANEGDEQAQLVISAMIYQVAKEIGAMSTVLSGEVDRIIITGGIAFSKSVVDAISSRVRFIAPIVVIPGEEELESLACGALRVLLGEEKAKSYF